MFIVFLLLNLEQKKLGGDQFSKETKVQGAL